MPLLHKDINISEQAIALSKQITAHENNIKAQLKKDKESYLNMQQSLLALSRAFIEKNPKGYWRPIEVMVNNINIWDEIYDLFKLLLEYPHFLTELHQRNEGEKATENEGITAIYDHALVGILGLFSKYLLLQNPILDVQLENANNANMFGRLETFLTTTAKNLTLLQSDLTRVQLSSNMLLQQYKAKALKDDKGPDNSLVLQRIQFLSTRIINKREQFEMQAHFADDARKYFERHKEAGVIQPPVKNQENQQKNADQAQQQQQQQQQQIIRPEDVQNEVAEAEAQQLQWKEKNEAYNKRIADKKRELSELNQQALGREKEQKQRQEAEKQLVSQRIENQDALIRGLQAEIFNLKTRGVPTHQTELYQYASEISENHEKLEARVRKLIRRTEKLKSTEKLIQELDQKLENTQTEIRSKDTQIQQQAAEIGILRNEVLILRELKKDAKAGVAATEIANNLTESPEKLNKDAKIARLEQALTQQIETSRIAIQQGTKHEKEHLGLISELEGKDAEIATLQGIVRQNEVKIREHSADIEKLQSHIVTKTKEAAADRDHEAKTHRATVELLTQEVNELRQQSKKLPQLQSELEQINKQLVEYKSNEKELTEQLKKAEFQLKELQTTSGKHAEELGKFQNNLATKTTTISELEAQLTSAREEVKRHAEEIIKQKESHKGAIKETLAKYKQSREAHTTEVAEIKEQLKKSPTTNPKCRNSTRGTKRPHRVDGTKK